MIAFLVFAVSGCVTDSDGNTRFDAATAASVLDAGERMYRDYSIAQHPERFPTYP